jgi:hypothetical protein
MRAVATHASPSDNEESDMLWLSLDHPIGWVHHGDAGSRGAVHPHFHEGAYMRRRLLGTAVIGLAVLVPAIPASAGQGRAGAKGHVRVVQVRDACDPATFNAEIGPGTCVDHTGARVTFDQFLAKLNPVDFGHPKWRNIPGEVHVKEGDSLLAAGRGGEVHTFTEVEEFGPGCVGFINDKLGLTGPPVADCATNLDPTNPANTLVVPGKPGLNVHEDEAGTERYECLIHPWMRTIVDIRER